MIHRWMKGALNSPDRNRPHSHRMGKTEGKHQKAGVVRHSRHEGLAPVRLSKGSKPVRAPLRANFLPDIGSIGLSFSRSLGSWSVDPGSLFALIGSAAARSDGPRPSVRDLKNGASPLPRSKRLRRTRNEDQGNDTENRGERAAPTRPRGLRQGGKRPKKKKKAPGVGVIP